MWALFLHILAALLIVLAIPIGEALVVVALGVEACAIVLTLVYLFHWRSDPPESGRRACIALGGLLIPAGMLFLVVVSVPP
ncbi:MAG: hypothetical protein L6Q71_03850 [Planctomycetes bacterium]|nr:hypothetical protein [Planctomycetota bacterium]NUQ34316.1 hypothetical protein [Planctomycetaceae bacterium]